MAILEEAEKNDIPLSLAFALAYTESRYNVNAVNKNRNASIDRGLFQLNNRSFPQLKEEDFFDPAISAKYGMSHLRFCLNIAGNEVSALAMYNAGTSKVRADNTPQSTLNYVGKIMAYQDKLEKLFADEVLSYYETTRPMTGISVAFFYDMAGNVAEWTSTVYTEAGVDAMNDINPQLRYNAAIEDPYRLKKKSVRGGSWKDPESYIRSAWRSSEYQNQPRSYIGFRCVRSLANSTSDKARESKK